jgi:hypothetical protein
MALVTGDRVLETTTTTGTGAITLAGAVAGYRFRTNTPAQLKTYVSDNFPSLTAQEQLIIARILLLLARTTP